MPGYVMLAGGNTWPSLVSRAAQREGEIEIKLLLIYNDITLIYQLKQAFGHLEHIFLLWSWSLQKIYSCLKIFLFAMKFNNFEATKRNIRN